MKNLLILTLFTSFWPIFVVRSESNIFGAILRVRSDAHLIAAINYTLDWLHLERPELGDFEVKIRYLDERNDHYDALGKACKLLDEIKISALFGSSDPQLTNQLKKLSYSLNIPFFTVADDFSYYKLDSIGGVKMPVQSEASITVFPQAYLIEALSDLIVHWKWTRVIIIYAEVDRLKRLIPFLESEIHGKIRFYFVRVENSNFLDAAQNVKNLEDCVYLNPRECFNDNRILVDMNPKDTFAFFVADLRFMSMELFRHNHARFVTLDPRFPSPGALAPRVDFCAFSRRVRKYWFKINGNDHNFRMSEASFMFDAIFLAANSIFTFNKIHSTFYKDKDDSAKCGSSIRPHSPYRHGQILIEHIKNTSLIGLTGDLSRVSSRAHNISFRIHSIGFTGKIEDIGYWEPITNVNINMSRDSRVQLQRNVKVSDELKPHFRVTTIMERPYVMLKKNHIEMDENSQLEGFCIDLLEELATDLGFTYSIHIVKDGKYGSADNNGTWNGMIGEILRHEADMVVAPFTANFRRAEVVDFTKPFLSLGISILFKIPEDLQPDIFSFLNPLSLEIWISILISICALTFGMYLVAHLTPYEWNLNFSCCIAHQPHPAAQYETPRNSFVQLCNNYSFWNTLWYVMSTMLKGGCDFGPRAVSTRLLGGTWWVFTLVIVSAYTANLAAVLTVSRPHIPIRSLDDLANQSDISYGAVAGGSTMQFFQESKIDTHIKMWKQMKSKDVLVASNRQGVEKVLRENYAYLMESSSLEYEVQQNCNLTQIGGVLGSKGYGIALRKKSEWTDRISRQILLYQKSGIIEMKKTKWWRSKGASCHGIGSTVKQQRISLNLNNVSGLFVILSLGFVFSLIIVIVEFYCRKREERQQI